MNDVVFWNYFERFIRKSMKAGLDTSVLTWKLVWLWAECSLCQFAADLLFLGFYIYNIGNILIEKSIATPACLKIVMCTKYRDPSRLDSGVIVRKVTQTDRQTTRQTERQTDRAYAMTELHILSCRKQHVGLGLRPSPSLIWSTWICREPKESVLCSPDKVKS